jgi:hypothetical protein
MFDVWCHAELRDDYLSGYTDFLRDKNAHQPLKTSRIIPYVCGSLLFGCHIFH